MSPIELLAPASPVASTSPPAGVVDGARFAGLLNDQARPTAPLGRLAVGRMLSDQAELDPGDGRVDPGLTPLVRPGPFAEPTTAKAGGDADGPLIQPGAPGGGGVLADRPLVRPDVPGAGGPAEGDQPLILPGNPTGAPPAKTAGPLILPDGVKAGGADTPLVLPGAPAADGEALALLAASGGQARAERAADAILRVVAQPPVVAPVAEPPPVEPAADGDLPDAPPLPGATGSGETARPAQTPAQAAGAGPADARAAGAETARSAAVQPGEGGQTVVDPSSEGDPARELAPTGLRDTPGVQLVRADAAAVQRMSFDAVTQIAAQIIRRLEGRATRFEMELHPADMGRVDVRLDIDAEGRVAARLAFDNPVAAADLRGRADELRRNLEDAGFQLSDDALDFSDGERREGGRPFDLDEQGPFARAATAADHADLVAQPALKTVARLGLDMRI